MDTQIVNTEQWSQWSEEIKERLRRSASDFVAIGYRLKQIRDSGFYDGAADLYEFAHREYGLEKSAVSRFIAINERYSENGNSLYLKEEYKTFKYSQLSEMLTLPDSQHEYINESTTVKDIREMKQFNAEEKEKADGEQLNMFKPIPNNAPMGFEDIIVEFFRENKNDWEDCADAIKTFVETEEQAKECAEIMCPSGNRMYRKGAAMLMIQDYTRGLTLRRMNQEDEKISWERFVNTFWDAFLREPKEYNDYYPTETPKVEPEFLSKHMNMPVATTQEREEETNENAGTGRYSEEVLPVATSAELPSEDVHESEAMGIQPEAEDNHTEEGKKVIEVVEEIKPEDISVVEDNIPEWLKTMRDYCKKEFDNAMELLLKQRYNAAAELLEDIYLRVKKLETYKTDDEDDEEEE